MSHGEQESINNESGRQQLPSFTELYKSVANGTSMNMSLERTFSCESTDTASEMLYDSFDHEFLSSESFEMEENCFLDDLTEEDITACISNDEVQSFEYVVWMKKLADIIGEDYGTDKDSELAMVLGAIEYIKYLKWSLDFTSDSTSPQSICSFSSIELDYSPEVRNSIDLNTTFRRKLSFGGDNTPVVPTNQPLNSQQQPCNDVNTCNVFYPNTIQNNQLWRYEEDSQNTLLGYKCDDLHVTNVNNIEDTTDMSFVEDNMTQENEWNNNSLFFNENANLSFMDDSCQNINSNIYASLQQMCLVQDENSGCSSLNVTTNNDTSNSGNEGPTEEDLIQHYFMQYPTLSSLLVDYSSEESDPPVVKRRKRKPRPKRKTKRKGGQNSSRQTQGADVDCTVQDTLVAEADSTTNSAVHKKEERKSNKRTIGLKRPKNGFIRFSIEYRKELAEKNPNLDNRDVSKMLGQKWRKMTPEERKPYEEEFANDLEEMKKQNPSWKYAPHKRMGHDEIEPMPSRLRPRDKLKRKFSPFLIKTLSAKKRRLSPRTKSKRSRKGSIMKCSICSKYQQIYGVPTKNLENLRSLWICGLNPDPKNNTCLEKPSTTNEGCLMLSSPAIITTSGPFTSVISRSCNSVSVGPSSTPQRPIRHAMKPYRQPFRATGRFPTRFAQPSFNISAPKATGRFPTRPAQPSFNISGLKATGTFSTRFTQPSVNSSRHKLKPVASVSVKPIASPPNTSLPSSINMKQYCHSHNLRPVNTSMPLAVTNSSIYPNLTSSGKTNASCLTFAESRKLAMPDCQMESLSSQTFSSTLVTPSAAEQTTGSDKPVLSYVPTNSTTVSTTQTQSVVCNQKVSSSQKFFHDYKAFISFLQPNSQNTSMTPIGKITSNSSATGTTPKPFIPETSTAINITSSATGNIPTTNAYITVIPKSIWNTLSTDDMGLLLSQRNYKEQ